MPFEDFNEVHIKSRYTKAERIFHETLVHGREAGARIPSWYLDHTAAKTNIPATLPESGWKAGLLIQGIPGVPQDPFAPRRGPLGPSPGP
jgi:hypothetical protein